MKWGYHHRNKIIGGALFGLVLFTGTYNAVVINSDSYISGTDVRLVKRLDEVYGVVKPGRLVASSLKWEKLSLVEARKLKREARRDLRQEKRNRSFEAASSVVPDLPGSAPEVVAQAAVQEELSLKLVDVMNPKKWAKGLNQTQFTGSLNTRDGVIEELAVSLPNEESISVSFSELTGNVFQYIANGESYSGMMYQVDQNSYKVNITSGPLEGTIMTFAGEPSVEQLAQQEQHEIQQEQNRQEVELTAEAPQEMPAEPVAENTTEQASADQSAYGAFADPNIPQEAHDAFAQDQAATQAALMQTQVSGQELPQQAAAEF